MLFNHQNLFMDASICADIRNIGRYMIQNIIPGYGATFCPGLHFSDHFDFLLKFLNLFWYQES